MTCRTAKTSVVFLFKIDDDDLPSPMTLYHRHIAAASGANHRLMSGPLLSAVFPCIPCNG
eukprot:scaffold618751_cov37-Prasinocladus_malaysianus.AAC.1